MRRSAVLALSIAALASACGSGSGASSSTPAASAPGASAPATSDAPAPDAAKQTIAAAMRRTVKAGSAHFDITARVGEPGQGLVIRGAGAYAYDGSHAWMESDMDVPGQPAIALDLRVVGRDIYLRSPVFAQVTGGRWLTWREGRSAHLGAVDLSQLSSMDSSSPAYALSFLTGAQEVVEIGEDEVDGVAATRYHVDVDIDLVDLAGLGPGVAKELRKLRDHLVSRAIGIDIWIDGDGLIRRERMDMEMRAEGVTVPSVMEMDLSQHGAAVRVQRPAAADTLAASELS